MREKDSRGHPDKVNEELNMEIRSLNVKTSAYFMRINFFFLKYNILCEYFYVVTLSSLI